MKRLYYAYVLDHLAYLDTGIASHFSRDDKFTLGNYIFFMVIAYSNILGMPLVVFVLGGGIEGILLLNMIALPVAIYIGYLHFKNHDEVVKMVKTSFKPTKVEKAAVKIIDKGSTVFFGLSLYLSAQGLPPI